MFKKLISLLAICFVLGFTSVPTSFGADTNVSVTVNSTFIDLQNLHVLYNSATPNTKIDMTWSNLIIGTTQTQQTSVLTLDAATSGVNGMDTGSLSANTYYYLYAISNGSTTGSLLSLSSTSPTMPTGYTNKRLISAFFTDGSAHFYKQEQVDREVTYLVGDGVFRALNGGTSTTSVVVSLASSGVPPISISANLHVFLQFPTTTGPASNQIYLGKHGQATRIVVNIAYPNSSGNSWQVGADLRNFITDSSQQVDYSVNGTPAAAYIDVFGYYLPI